MRATRSAKPTDPTRTLSHGPAARSAKPTRARPSPAAVAPERRASTWTWGRELREHLGLVRCGVLSFQAFVDLTLGHDLVEQAELPIVTRTLCLARRALGCAAEVAAGGPPRARMPSAPAQRLFQWKGLLQQSVCCTVSCSSPSLHTTHGLVEGILYSASREQLVLVPPLCRCLQLF